MNIVAKGNPLLLTNDCRASAASALATRMPGNTQADLARSKAAVMASAACESAAASLWGAGNGETAPATGRLAWSAGNAM
ncbi:hypothetical protein D3C80_2030090 [compost metagenome]